MSGYKSGVATIIREEEPRAIYTHCYGHSLNLACNDILSDNASLKEMPLTQHKKSLTWLRNHPVGMLC